MKYWRIFFEADDGKRRFTDVWANDQDAVRSIVIAAGYRKPKAQEHTLANQARSSSIA